LRRQVGGLHAGDVVGAVCRYDRPPFAWLVLESVDAVLVRELSDVDVAREGAPSRDALVGALRSLYPRTDALVRVRFGLAESLPVSSSAVAMSSSSPR
jgi:hypothetical protein